METSSNSKASKDQSDTNIVRLAEKSDQVAWVGDLKQHRRMIATYSDLADARSQVCDCLHGLADGDTLTEETDKSLRALPSECRVRMALRLGLSEVNRMQDAPYTPRRALNEEFEFLDQAMKRHQAEIEAIELRILSTQPENAFEARTLMSFLSKLLAAGRRIDSVDLAAHIERYSAVMTPEKTANDLHAPSFCRFN